jgi:LPS export ABC transporter protein LptC
MNTHSIKILRKWLIGIIICVLLAVVSNYILNIIHRPSFHKPTFSSLGPDEITRSSGIIHFDFKKGINRFRIHAPILTKMKDDRIVGEGGVKAYKLNPNDSIHSEIHSQKAAYDKQRGQIDFSGNVQLIRKGYEIRTETLHYDLNNEVGSSEDVVQIISPSANGKARGMRYHDEEELLELGSEVDFTFNTPSQSGNPSGTGKMRATSERATFEKQQSRMIFLGKAQIETQNSGLLSGNSIEANLSPDLKNVQSLTALGSASFRTEDKDEKQVLSSDRMFIRLGKENQLASIRMEGQSAFSLSSPAEEEYLSADKIDLEFDPADAGKETISQIHGYKNVQFRLKRGTEQTLISGAKLDAQFVSGKDILSGMQVEGQSALVLSSPAEEEHLNAGKIDLKFDTADSDKATISRIRANNNVRFQLKRGTEQTLISGGQLDAQFVPKTEKMERLHVVNDAKLSTEGGKDAPNNELRANDIQVDFKQKQERIAIKEIRAEGSAHWLSKPPVSGADKNREPERKLDAALLKIVYSGNGDYPEYGNASGKVVISESAAGQSSQMQMRLMLADSASFQFFPKNGLLKNMNAEGHVQTTGDRKKPDSKAGSSVESFRTTSDKMAATFSVKDGRSAVESAAQSGNFTYQDPDYSATTGKCDYNAGKEIMVLTDSPKISDNMNSTTGDRVEYDQKQKTIFAHGNVQSKMIPQKGGGLFFGSSQSGSSSPTIIMADEMQYQKEPGQFRYSGKVRSISENWQLDAQVLEIFNKGERIEAHGDVWNRIKESAPSGKSKASPQSPITIQSEHLSYLKESNEATYSGNVDLASADLKLSSNNFAAKLDPDGTFKHAVASGKVHIVETEGRESMSDVANWSLDAGKFEIAGTPAQVFDPAQGRSRAPRLTYFKANDRILLGK